MSSSPKSFSNASYQLRSVHAPFFLPVQEFARAKLLRTSGLRARVSYGVIDIAKQMGYNLNIKE